MKKLFYSIVGTVLLLSSTVPMFAQTSFRTAYFLEGYSYRYKFNPAFASERNFVGPLIGNSYLGVDSNLSLANFLWKDDDGNVNLFTAPGNTDEFIRNLRDQNDADIFGGLSLVSFGLWGQNGKCFHSFDWSVKTKNSFSVPRSMLEMMKCKSLTDSYVLDKVGFSSTEWSEFSYGLSGTIGGCFHIGGRLKFLVGFANVDMQVGKTTIDNLGPGLWLAAGGGTLDLFLPSDTYIPTKGEIDPACSPVRADRLKFSETRFANSGKIGKALWPVPGYGVAADFGISCNIGRYVEVSTSVLDAGFMRWRNHQIASTPSSWSINALTAVGKDMILKDQWNATLDIMDEIIPFSMENADAESVTNMFTMTLNTGVNVRMPFYDRLSFGAAGTMRIDAKKLSFYELRAIAGVSPVKCLDFAVDYAYCLYGHSCGFVMNLHCNGLNLFLGTDSFLPVTRWSNGLPAGRLNTCLSFGLNVTFGPKHSMWDTVGRRSRS